MDVALHSALAAALPPSIELVRLSVTEGGWFGLTVRGRQGARPFTVRVVPERAHDAPVRSTLGGWFSPDSRAGLGLAQGLLQRPTWVRELVARLPHLALDSRRGVASGESVRVLERLGIAIERPSFEQPDLTPRRLFAVLNEGLARRPTALGSLVVDHVRQSSEAACLSVQLRLEEREVLRLLVGAAAHVQRPFAVFDGTAVALDHGGTLDPNDVPWRFAVAASWVSASVAGPWQWPDGALEPTERTWPREATPSSQREGIDAPSGTANDELHLELESECGQACVFCEVRDVVTPADGGDAALRRYEALLREGYARGCTRLHLGGVDPLSFSRLLPLLTAAREIGYRSLTVTTPGRRFADPGFRRAFREHAPTPMRAVIPLYGATAAVHDAIVGVPGAHAEVHEALSGLREEWGADEVTVMMVAVRGNAQEQAAVVEWATQHRLPTLAQPVYPMSGKRTLAWETSAVRLSEVVAGFAPALRRAADEPELRGRLSTALAQLVPYPCVRAAGLAASDWAFDRQRLFAPPPLAGVDSGAMRTRHRRDSAPLVPCPHVARCALAGHCPRAFYDAYVGSFGPDEFVPVGS